MLKLNLMLFMMIIMSMKSKSYWWQSTSLLLIMTFMSMMFMNSMNSMLSFNTYMDLMSYSLVMLSIFITSLMFMSSKKIFNMNNIPLRFTIMCMILLLILINAFTVNNLFLFYIWFEASLIPTMMIILMWGYQPERLQASMYMMIYTVSASLPMLLIFIWMYNSLNSTYMSNMSNIIMYVPYIMTPLIISGFLVKLPMFMVHLWLPKAHVEAPIAGSMILAAILLKLGGYGICRLMLMMPKNIMSCSTLLMSISLVGGIITSMICIRQPDLKSLIAYSSVGHMGIMLAGTMSFSNWGMYGSLLMMIAHGITSSAMFSLANINYELTHTRSMFLMKGMMSSIPVLTLWWFLFTSINMAAPPSLNLLSEIILITATMSMSSIYLITLVLMTFMTGCYSLIMYGNTQHGAMNNFMNPLHSLNNSDYNMLLAHIIPINLITLMSEYSSMWL